MLHNNGFAGYVNVFSAENKDFVENASIGSHVLRPLPLLQKLGSVGMDQEIPNSKNLSMCHYIEVTLNTLSENLSCTPWRSSLPIL